MQGMFWVIGDMLCQGLCFGLQGFMGVNLFYQFLFQCFGGIDCVVGECYQVGFGDVDDVWQQLGVIIVRNDVQVYEVFGEQG